MPIYAETVTTPHGTFTDVFEDSFEGLMTSPAENAVRTVVTYEQLLAHRLERHWEDMVTGVRETIAPHSTARTTDERVQAMVARQRAFEALARQVTALVDQSRGDLVDCVAVGL